MRVLALACAALLTAGQPAWAVWSSLDVELPSAEPIVAAGPKAAGRIKLDRISGPGFSTLTASGNPALACALIYVALPPNADLETVRIAADVPSRILPSTYDIDPVPTIAPLDLPYTHRMSQAKNPLVYGTNSFYPPEHIRLREVGQLRTWKIAVVEYWPYSYNPVSGKLRKADARSVRIAFETESAAASQPPDKAAADMSGFIVNADQAAKWYGNQAQKLFGSSVLDNPTSDDGATGLGDPTSDYVIITTSAIASSSARLSEFCTLLNLRGFSTRVVTESDWGGGLGNRAADNIRAWLAAHYIILGIRYALLIGNPDPASGDVPMKMLWPCGVNAPYPEAPSDYYYSDLTGNWDLDSDSYAGEYADDFGPGGVDRIPDVYVGRIPYYGSIADLDAILRKIIDYQSAKLGEWSRRFLLAMKPLDQWTPAYQLGENIRRDVALPSGLNAVRIYDQNYDLQPPPERTPCEQRVVKEEWANGAGAALWMAHGGPTGSGYIIDSASCFALDDSRPTMAYAASCSNGMPENPENAGYALLRRGAVAVVAASRASWYYVGERDFTNSDSVGGIGYQYVKFLFAGKESCGDALARAKLAIPMYVWPNHLVMNLYGDPSLAFSRPAPGAVAGRVTDIAGAPIAGALIRTTDGRISASSREDGSFMLRGADQGTLDFIVSADGWYSQRFCDVPVACGKLTHVDVALVRGRSGRLSGRVCDDYGYPLSGAKVEILELAKSVVTDDDGAYVFHSLPPGDYTALASKPPFAQCALECRITEENESTLDFTLHLRDGNALINGGFEKGFINGLGVFWHSYSTSISSASPTVGSDCTKYGFASQKLVMTNPLTQSYVGVYQVAKVVPGRPYSIVAWQRDHYGGSESLPSDNLICRIGWDLTGGTDPLSNMVNWYVFSPSHDVWHSFFRTVQPYAPNVTIFLEARRKQPGDSSDCCAWYDGVSLNGPVEAPPVPVVFLNDRFQSDRTCIRASWTCSAADVANYECAVSRTTSGDHVIPEGGWISVGTDTSVARTGFDFHNGDVVRVLVRARNEWGTVSETGFSEPLRIVDDAPSVAHAKLMADGTWVRLRNLVMTRISWGGRGLGEGPVCFLEAADRSAGIVARGTWSGIPYLEPGAVVTAVGRIATDDPMPYLHLAELMPSSAKAGVRPLAMTNKSIGGINQGLLITTTGRVLHSEGSDFVVSDGSLKTGLTVRCFDSASPPKVGAFVIVTGIAAPDGLWAFASDDIRAGW